MTALGGFSRFVPFALVVGAWLAARAFMLALGCLQSQKCHTNRCPVGVATQDASRERALIVSDKSERGVNFHAATTAALEQITAAVGVDSPSQLAAAHFYHRLSPHEVHAFAGLYRAVAPGAFLAVDFDDPFWKPQWQQARSDSFAVNFAQ